MIMGKELLTTGITTEFLEANQDFMLQCFNQASNTEAFEERARLDVSEPGNDSTSVRPCLPIRSQMEWCQGPA